jgi:hypothetical protein
MKVQILIHPRSFDDIQRDENEERKEITLSKIKTYPILENPPDANKASSFLTLVGPPQSANDDVDNQLVFAVKKNAVDYLISEDHGLLAKADKISLRDRVLSIEDAVVLFTASKVSVLHPPALKELPVYHLEINDPFFNSLKSVYPGFVEWWAKISKEGRKCWVYFNEDNSIGALLVYKQENESIESNPPLPKKKRLKLCTFKVDQQGQRIGELFIKLSVRFCVDNRIDEMYLTCFPEAHEYLIDLIGRFGFNKIAKIKKEDLFLKKLIPDSSIEDQISATAISEIFYPTFKDGYDIRKFIIPIQPEFHERLFTGFPGRQTTLPEHLGDFIVEGNTISKAYLSHSPETRIRPGDIVLFYRSHDLKQLTSLGVVERVALRLRRQKEVMDLVVKRTVYSIDEIVEMLRKPTTVILFRLHFHLPKPIRLERMKELGILNTAPQSIIKVKLQRYRDIKAEGGIDERYTLD